MDKFVFMLISAAKIIISTSYASSSLDGFHTNNISLNSSRYKRQCANIAGCELPLQLPWIPARTNCVVPEHPDGGKWTVFDGPRKNPGEIVPAKTILQFKCDAQYKLYPEIEFSICYRQWNVVPTCLKTCSSLRSTRILHVSCEIEKKETSCTDPYDGTSARVTCVLSKVDRFLNCVNGSWDASLPTCIPESLDSSLCTGSKCKFQYPDVNNETITSAVIGEFPFMAAIGHKRKSDILFTCSGALISNKYIIIPAYCANSGVSGTPDTVRLGTLNPDTNEPVGQDRRIKDIKIHPNYKPPSRYNDIALIELETAVTLNPHVQPISLTQYQAIDGRGILVGWLWLGLDMDYGLKRTTMATITVDECRKHYPAIATHAKGIDDNIQLCKKWTNKSSSDYVSSPIGVFVSENKEVPCKYSLVSIPSLRRDTAYSVPEVDQKVFPYIDWINSIALPPECNRF